MSDAPPTPSEIDVSQNNITPPLSNLITDTSRIQAARSRGSSFTRHMSVRERLRSRRASESTHHEDNEDPRRKSRILLGGQKLFRGLRD